ncbi:hypothetical protein AB2N08_11505 [Massilia aurea]|uniref:hypothetical protein n=1 Tax=Massilia aurea TaxID=373040 RepID=UPI003462A052
MDANQRSEVNNQTNNGANEKWNSDAKGATRDGASEQRAPSGTGMAHGDRPSETEGQLATTGGQQGNTDSHQRAMEMHSDAWGKLNDPLGNRQGKTRTSDNPNPPASVRPAHDAGNGTGNDGGNDPGNDTGIVPGTDDREARGTEAGVPGVQYGDIYGNRQSADGENRADTQDASSSKIQESTDRNGSQTGETRRDAPVDNIHQSNDLAGGLPRSGGNGGPRTEGEGYQTGGSMHAEPNPVHESNDAAGGYPRSPGGANQLAGDRKMDDDTGFSRK